MASDFGELVLVLGDIHIPFRAGYIHENFQKMLVPNRMQRNLVKKDMCDELKLLAQNVHIVKGSYDIDDSYPETKVIQVGQFKIGLIHGHQIIPWSDPSSLAMIQRQLNVDILVSGNSHRNEVNEYEGKWYINPGSITGSYSSTSINHHFFTHPATAAADDQQYTASDTGNMIPSFILLAIQGNKVVTYIYELHGDHVDVSKTEFCK